MCSSMFYVPEIMQLYSQPGAGRDLQILPDVFSADKRQEAEVDHVPRGAVLVSHQIQSHGHMGVTVVTAQVVLVKGKK